MNVVRKVQEARRREKAEKKRDKREARRKLKAADATAIEATRNSVTPKQ